MIRKAVQENNLERLKALLASSVNIATDIDSKDIDGNTALIIACNNGHEDIVRELLIHGQANINIKDNYGNTPLIWASMRGHVECVELLLNHHGSDLTITNKQGMNALMIASNYGEIGVVQILLEKGADLHIKDGNGKTALDHAETDEMKEYLSSIDSS